MRVSEIRVNQIRVNQGLGLHFKCIPSYMKGKMHVSEIRVKQFRVNQGLGVQQGLEIRGLHKT